MKMKTVGNPTLLDEYAKESGRMLKKIKEILSMLVLGFGCGSLMTCYRKREKIVEIRRESDKHLEMFLLMNTWLSNKRKGKMIGNYLKKKGFQNIAIYGMGYIGKNLYEELIQEGIIAKYLIDQNKNISIDGRSILTPGKKIETIDVIIVTSIYNYSEIEKNLQSKYESQIVSLADIIYKM